MKKLILILTMILLAGVAIPQELVLANSAKKSSTRFSVEEPIPSYWLKQDLTPTNYQVVSQSILYDPRALQSGLEGTVVVQIEVNEQGNYHRHRVLNDAHLLLVQAVEDKIAYLTFPQPEYQGKPVSTLVTVPFRFRLTDGW